MNPLFVTGIWLSLGALLSLLAGSGITRRRRPAPPTTPADHIEATAREEARPRAAGPTRYASPNAVEWGIAAHRAGIDMLLATRPGAIRRVTAPRPE